MLTNGDLRNFLGRYSAAYYLCDYAQRCSYSRYHTACCRNLSNLCDSLRSICDERIRDKTKLKKVNVHIWISTVTPKIRVAFTRTKLYDSKEVNFSWYDYLLIDAKSLDIINRGFRNKFDVDYDLIKYSFVY